jgi:acyl carrier protein phosphodiesterase
VAPWVVAGLAFLVAAVALAVARRVSRRLDALGQSYWELRYDYTRLRSQVARLDPEVEAAAAPPEPAAPASVTFVPLSSFKKKQP